MQAVVVGSLVVDIPFQLERCPEPGDHAESMPRN